jgi:hypothetical protein
VSVVIMRNFFHTLYNILMQFGHMTVPFLVIILNINIIFCRAIVILTLIPL